MNRSVNVLIVQGWLIGFIHLAKVGDFTNAIPLF
jgi:hypothetical protein